MMKTSIQTGTPSARRLAHRACQRPVGALIGAATRVTVVIAAAAVLCACASSGPVAEAETATVEKKVLLRPILHEETIRVTAASVGADALGADATSTSRRRTAGKVAAGTAGALGGAMLGAGGGLAAGIACGPLAIICSPIGAAVGAVGGLAVGGVAGAYAVGADTPRRKPVRRLPRSLRDVASAAQDRLATSQPLADAFATHSAGRWIIDNSASEGPHITVTVEQFDFTRGRDKKLVMNLISSMTVVYPSEQGPTTARQTFRFESPQYTVERWSADEGALLNAEIERALEGQAAEMTQQLIHPTLLQPTTAAQGSSE